MISGDDQDPFCPMGQDLTSYPVPSISSLRSCSVLVFSFFHCLILAGTSSWGFTFCPVRHPHGVIPSVHSMGTSTGWAVLPPARYPKTTKCRCRSSSFLDQRTRNMLQEATLDGGILTLRQLEEGEFIRLVERVRLTTPCMCSP